MIKGWEPPTNVRGVQSFLGFCNFYRRFIQDFSRTAKPLVQLTKKHIKFLWDASCNASFEELKRRLMEAPILRHYRAEKQTMIETGASNEMVGGVLTQLYEDGQWHPVAFFTKIMLPAEMNYAIFDKEMLSIVKAFKIWGAECTASPHCIKVYTNYKALE